ncbi:phosphate ABC transporter permease PstA [Halosegnis sp.]|uniref:phosphate ABC transporter permease PstA n=1 Tax=Halosegnis sp. TaxID=2864959 RepID=UPI0035D45889
MATGTETDDSPVFGRVSRARGVVFEYVTFVASVFGIASLAVLLGYVVWDAFGLENAAPAWYGIFLLVVVGPVVGFLLYARRDPLASEVALEVTATALGGLLAGTALVIVLDIIAGPGVWFAYFLTVILPVAGLGLYARQSEAGWVGLAILAALVVGPVVGTLALGPLSGLAFMLGPPGVYFLSLVVPGALAVRYVVDEWFTVGNGTYAAGAMLVVAVAAVPAVDTVAAVSRSVWLILLTTLVAPLTAVVGRNAALPERRAGLAGPLAFVVGVGLLAIVPDLLGIAGPTPWFDYQYVTSAPSQTAEQAGLYPAIVGSVFIIVLVALLTLLLGVGAALYLEEYAPSGGRLGTVTRLIRINISNLAGVPSVVYGLLGLAVFANTLQFGFGTVVTAAFTLSLLILPIVIISAREAIRSVPDSLRDASYGMGATRWQTVKKVILPRAVPGILTGTILALGRAIGETAPLIMIGVATTKFTPPSGPFDSTTAMPMQVFVWSSYPGEAFQHGVVAAGVVTLLIVLLSMNSIAILLRNKFERGDI